MTQNYIAALDTNPANNTDFIGVGVLGSDLVSTADNAFRANGGMLARFYSDFGGTGVTAGTANAITITTPSAYTAYTTGIRLRFIASAANSGAVTVNVDAVGAKAIRKISGGTDVALVTGDILAAVGYEIVYSTAANAAAGAWVLLNTDLLPLTGGTLTGPLNVTVAATGTISTLTSTDAGASGGPDLDIYRNSASPAASDVLGSLLLTGNRGSGAKHTYFSITPTIVTTAPGGSVAKVTVAVANDFTAGSPTNFLYFGGNAAGTATTDVIGLPLGRLSFPAAQNASSDANTLDDYEEGTWTPALSFAGGSTGITYSARTGTYLKVGKTVFASGRIFLTSKGSSTGAASITLPPFALENTAGNYGVASFGYWGDMSSVVGNLLGVAVPGASSFAVRMSGAAATPSATETNFTNITEVIFNIQYRADN